VYLDPPLRKTNPVRARDAIRYFKKEQPFWGATQEDQFMGGRKKKG
jgi:hypothetical protein